MNTLKNIAKYIAIIIMFVAIAVPLFCALDMFDKQQFGSGMPMQDMIQRYQYSNGYSTVISSSVKICLDDYMYHNLLF